VVIVDDRITFVGKAAHYPFPADAQVIDAREGTVLPGIIDAHVHGASTPAIQRQFLLSGVTSVCDLGFPVEDMPKFDENTFDQEPVARGFQAGPIITVPGGYPRVGGQVYHLSYEVTNPDEARAAVADLINRGADVIKIALEPGPTGASWPVLSLQEVKAIVEEAHGRGRLVRAHVTCADLLDVALDARVDVIEHIPIPHLSEADWKVVAEDREQIQLPADYEAQLARMIEQHVVMVPTLSVMPAICNTNWYGIPEEYQPLCSKLFLEVVRRFHDLGGRVALGNDYGNQDTEPGMPLREMQFLLQAGLPPMEVLQAGTVWAATVCGHGNELGTLAPGMLADVIVVDGDPLQDMQSMSRVVLVIKNGEIAVISEEMVYADQRPPGQQVWEVDPTIDRTLERYGSCLS
jgi:imidazolonepropionase-like amidohydrolase